MARLICVLSLVAALAVSAAAASTSHLWCSGALMSMMDCVAYVAKGSKEKQPVPRCCKGLSNVVEISPLCLCVALREAIWLGIDVDLKRALGLPAVCSVKAEAGNCGVAPPPHVPGPAPGPPKPPTPVPTPTPAPPKPPTPAPTPAPPKPPTTPAPPKPPTPAPTPAPPKPTTPTPAPPSPPQAPTPPPSSKPPTAPPPSETPPSPLPGPPLAPTVPETPSPAPGNLPPSTGSDSGARRLPISAMTVMIALVVAAWSNLEL